MMKRRSWPTSYASLSATQITIDTFQEAVAKFALITFKRFRMCVL